VQGRAKPVHVQQHEVPARVEKKKMVAPRSTFMWRRKEMQPPKTVSSRAGRAGGCGEEGKRDLKMTKTRDVVAAITPRFLTGGEDDMGTTGEVQPNFRTPPS
jgi:hypothetical protein